MKIDFINETEEFVNNLSLADRTRVYWVRDLVNKFGFIVGPKYFKKISPNGIWELRANRVRLFILVRGSLAVCVHAIYKKTQRLNNRDIKLSEKRSKEII